ncbi:MAG: hypothetical protein V1725_08150 [archaeon]
MRTALAILALTGLAYANDAWTPPTTFYLTDQCIIHAQAGKKDLNLHWTTEPLPHIRFDIGQKLGYSQGILSTPYFSINIEKWHLNYVLSDPQYADITHALQFTIQFEHLPEFLHDICPIRALAKRYL